MGKIRIEGFGVIEIEGDTPTPDEKAAILRAAQAMQGQAAAPTPPPSVPLEGELQPPAPPGLFDEIDQALGSAGRFGQRALANVVGAPIDALNAAILNPLRAGAEAIGVPQSILGVPITTGGQSFGGRQSLEALQRTFEDPAIAGATAASIAFPPAAPVLAAGRVAPLLARLGLTAPSGLGRLATTTARFGPTVGAAGAGGAAGGAGEVALQGGTPTDISRAALLSGLEMAGGEIAGLGLGGAAARVIAPAAGKVTDLGRAALDFARRGGDGEATKFLTGRGRGLPIAPADVVDSGLARGVQGLVETFLPSRAVVKSRRNAVTNRLLELGPNEDLNPAIRSLIMADTKEASLPRAARVADVVAAALGSNAVKRLKLDFETPRLAMFRLVTRHPEAALALKGKLSDERFNDLLAASLERLLAQSARNVNGRQLLDGEKLLSTWRDLPEETKALFSKETQQGIEGLGAFAAASRRVPQLADQPATAVQTAVTSATGAVPIISTGFGAATAGFGALGVFSSVLMARSLMDPKGFLNRYLVNESLGPEVLRIIGRETAKATSRVMTRGTLTNR